MTEPDDQSGFPADELLAAEYALGVLTTPERAAAERRIGREHVFAALVAAWEQLLAPWAGDLAAVAPPPGVWDRIAAQLPGSPPPRESVWRSLALWRGFALVSTVAAACLGVLLYLGALTSPPPLIATIEGGGHAIFVATIDAKRATVTVVPASYASDATRVPELWLIPPGGSPLPLGLLRADRAVDIAIPPAFAARTRKDAVLAVSLEPPGGAPDGKPTGPVIGSGKLTNV